MASVEVREEADIVPALVVSEQPASDTPATVQRGQLLVVLRQHLSSACGDGASPLKFVVTVLEVRGRQFSEPMSTVRLRTQVSDERGLLATTETSSSILGRLGGQRMLTQARLPRQPPPQMRAQAQSWPQESKPDKVTLL